MRMTRLAAGILALSLLPVLSCQKNQQEAEKFERADNVNFHRVMSDLSSFRLANGLTVYLQEEHTADQVAIEVVYDVGFMDEPKDRPQLCHVTEHLAVYCASGDFADEEAYKLITDERGGLINAETLGDFSHFDYVVPKSHFEDALRIEAARLGGPRCDAGILNRETDKVVDEMDKTLASQKPALTKFAMMALNQAVNHGESLVRIRMGAKSITLEEAKRFHEKFFRPNEMVMVVIGDIKKDEAEALIRKHFEPIASKPAPSRPATIPAKDIHAHWDVDANAIYLVAPGPYASQRERLILSMFGSFLHQFFNTSQELYGGNQIIYCSNQVYRVATIPFFIYAQPSGGRTPADLAPLLQQHLDRALTLIDEDERIETIKGAMVSFVTTSMLKPDVADYPLAHHQVIGQEALNVAIKHELREGLSVDDFTAEVTSITPDEFRKVVKSRMVRSKMFQITFTPNR